MRLLQDPYRFSNDERWLLGVLLVALALLAWAAWGPGAALLPSCPARSWLGLNCPGCGLTRGCLALAQGEPGTALAFNPLVLLVVPYVAYRLARTLVGAFSGRELVADWPRGFVATYEGLFLSVALGLGVIRGLSWLFPQANPHGLFLP